MVTTGNVSPSIWENLNATESKAERRKNARAGFWNMLNSVPARTLAILLSTAQPAYSQEIDFIETNNGNNTEIADPGGNLEQERRNISTLLRAAEAGFNIEDFKYEMTINPEIRDHIDILSSPVVLYTTKAISGDFFNRTGYQLEMIDVISIARVVQSRISLASDPLLFENVYLEVISHYPAHETVLGELFGKYLSEDV